MNLTATNEEVDAKFAEMKAPFPEEQFQERLKASNQNSRRFEACPATESHDR